MKTPDDIVKAHIYKTASKNFWKVAHTMDFDDLVQEGYLCWATVVHKYPHIDTPEHLMSLFKTTYWRHIMCIAAKGKYKNSDDEFYLVERPFADYVKPGETYDSAESFLESTMVDLEDCFGIESLVSEAPYPISEVIHLFVSDEGSAVLKPPYKRTADGRRETLNERVCKYLGFPPKTDLIGMLRSYLSDPDYIPT